MGSYEQGYEDGESSHRADWVYALDDVLPPDVKPWPSEVAEHIRRLAETHRLTEEGRWLVIVDDRGGCVMSKVKDDWVHGGPFQDIAVAGLAAAFDVIEASSPVAPRMDDPPGGATL